MAEKTVTLQPGESQVVSFEATPLEARTYQVSVNGLTGSFKASEPSVVKFGYVSSVRFSYFSVPGSPTEPDVGCGDRSDFQSWEVDVKNTGNVAGECALQCLVSTHGEYWGVDYPWTDFVPDYTLDFPLTAYTKCRYNESPYRISRLTLAPGEVGTFRGLCWRHFVPQYGYDVWAIRAKFIGDPGATEIKNGQVIQYG